eukprot:gene63076-86285_t
MEEIVAQDDVAWAARNEHWRAQSGQRRGYSARRERRSAPLILCGHGVSLRVDKGTLHICDGFTHWPQERVEYRLFKGARDLPPRIVMLDGSGSLSFEVISWLAAQNVSLVRLTYQGEVETVIGGAGYAADPHKVQWQIETRNDPARRIEFCCELITAKIESSLKTLTQVIPDSAARKIAISHAEGALFKIRSGQIQTVDD